MSAVTAERLAESPEDAGPLVAGLDPASPADRRAALDAIEGLVDRWVTPAAGLLSMSDEDPDHRWFDLRGIAGDDYSGLSMGLLERRFAALQEPPADAALGAALREEGIDISDAGSRAAFFRAWMATRAVHLIRALLDVVEDDPGLDAGEATWELDRLRALRDSPLPSLDRYLVERILARRS